MVVQQQQSIAIEGRRVLVAPQWVPPTESCFNPGKGLTWPTMQCNLQFSFSFHSHLFIFIIIITTAIDCKPTASSVSFWKSVSEDNPHCCYCLLQIFNTLYNTLYKSQSAKIILNCLRIKSIARSSCFYTDCCYCYWYYCYQPLLLLLLPLLLTTAYSTLTVTRRWLLI